MELTKNNIIIGVISFIALSVFLTIVYISSNQTSPTQIIEALKKIKPDDHVAWSSEKKNILIEYSDFQCPACKATHEFFKNQVEASGSANNAISKKITLVYRHFPLRGAHPYTDRASWAVESASIQGKFWEYSDVIFKNQEIWAKSDNPEILFDTYAKDLNLDVEKFKSDRLSQQVKDRVNLDASEGVKYGISSTPTLFLNGEKLEYRTYDELLSKLK
ncbi:MAG: thioredoxin domain-containing protein [Candidatus Roizmanbacteria bacterium]